MIVLASVRRPSAIMAGTSAERHDLGGHVLLLDTLPVAGDLGQAGAR